MRNRNKKLIILIALVAVVTVSVGFAAFSSSLLIKSSLSVNPNASDFGVVFSTSSSSVATSAVTPTKNPTTITATNATIDNSTIPTISNISGTFTAPGQSATYSFYAYNKGEYLAYLNSITFVSDKVCTAGEGTNQTLVDAACEDIKITVSIGNVEASATKQNITGETIQAGKAKQVTVKLEYISNGDVADGPFTVEFGDISMFFATVSGMNEPQKSIITFSINYNNEIITFQAEEGMTWEEFINSSYNTNNSFTNNQSDDYVQYEKNIVRIGYLWVVMDELIKSSQIYELDYF